MAVLNKEDFMSRLQERVGEDTSDDALNFIADMTDTFNEMESKSGGNNDAEWEKKYNDLDASWRKKYKERFFSSENANVEKEDEKETAEEPTYEDLFTESEV